jgi:hypothetical protein
MRNNGTAGSPNGKPNGSMKYRVKVFIDAHQDLYNRSLVYAGLCSLASAGQIDVRFVAGPARRRRSFRRESLPVCLEVEAYASGARRLFCIDLRDRSDQFVTDLLPHCDVYLKRSYYRPDVEKLPEFQHKVMPFGLNFPCRNVSSTERALGTVAPQYAARLVCAPTDSLRQLSEYFIRIRGFLCLPDVKVFEQHPAKDVDPTIVFQTRVWTQDQTDPDDAEEINEGRVALVRALREAFGDRFVGGIIPTTYACERYPQDVSEEVSRRDLYLAMSKRSLIGIYSRGLHHSLAFKLSEYLAAAKCIVTDPFHHELPVPLVDGKNFLSFTTPDECVRRCAELLKDPQLTAAMRRDNYRYYLDEVEPAAHMLRCFERAFAVCNGVAQRLPAASGFARSF